MLNIKNHFFRITAILILMFFVFGNLCIAGDVHTNDTSAGDCSFCISSESRKERTGNEAPLADSHICFSHDTCHQTALINTLCLLNFNNYRFFKPFDNIISLSQSTLSIFRPPKTISI